MCFTPEEKSALAARLGKPADTADADLVADIVLKLTATEAQATEATAKVTALSATVQTLTTERDAEKAKVLSLSASAPRDPDPMSLALITRAFKTDREQVIASGVISEAGMTELDNLLLSGGKPTPQALSLSAGSTDPFYSRVCEILRKNPGIKTNNGVDRVPTVMPPLSASGDDGKPVTRERLNDLLGMAGGTPLAKAG